MTENERNMEQVRVAGICGSLRAGSHTRQALTLALQGAEEWGAAVQMIDLRDYELVFCDGRRGQNAYPEGVRRLRRDLQQAHGVILATPEYHGGYSGVLKNALDLMGFAEFEGKMIGLLAVSGGSMGAANALNSLRSVGRSLHAWVLPQQVSISGGWKQFNPDGTLRDPEMAKRVRTLGRDVARFAFLHTSEPAMAFLQAWEEAPVNPGGA
jgi:NAD(P)H-dependent FMN reductase